MKTKTFLFITGKILFVIASAFVVIVLYLFRIIRRLSGALVALLELYCKKTGLYSFLRVEASKGEISGPIFTSEEIKIMAQKLPGNISRIQDIADHYGISVRQAQKVRKYADNLALLHSANTETSAV